MSSNASSIVLHIACHFTLAISIIVAISSVLETIHNEYALLADAINCVSATVHLDALLIAFNISSAEMFADSDNLSKLLCNGSFSIDASMKLFHNANILHATTVAVAQTFFNADSVDLLH
jgi:hypothetical protein